MGTVWRGRYADEFCRLLPGSLPDRKFKALGGLAELRLPPWNPSGKTGACIVRGRFAMFIRPIGRKERAAAVRERHEQRFILPITVQSESDFMLVVAWASRADAIAAPIR